MPRSARIPYFYKLSLLAVFLGCSGIASAQHFLSEYDSTLFLRDTLIRVVSQFQNLRFSGYIQPQAQWTQQEGAATFEGGNFAPHSNNRFLLRRTRLRADYQLPVTGRPLPLALFTFQLDVTERGALARDMFARYYGKGSQNIALTFGLFARPFGYEVNLSSAYRESPERARASQTLMPAERDLGLMATWERARPAQGRPHLKWDIGVFNGPGLSGPTDFDSYKDLISRLTLKPYALSQHITASAGLSLLYGGWRMDNKQRWSWVRASGNFEVDSSAANVGREAPRHYYGADAQLLYRHHRGKTELRAEYWTGRQPGTAATTVNPGTQPDAPTYLRDFTAGIFYFLQTIGSPRWELCLKYDWYDPNRYSGGHAIGAPGRNLTVADIRYDTWSGGITYYANANLKVLVWYSHPANEHTTLDGYTKDAADDVFTLRTQLRF